MVNYDTPRQYLIFNRTDFYSCSFGVTRSSNILCKQICLLWKTRSRPTVQYRACFIYFLIQQLSFPSHYFTLFHENSPFLFFLYFIFSLMSKITKQTLMSAIYNQFVVSIIYKHNYYNNMANVLTVKIGLKQTKCGHIVHNSCIYCVFSPVTKC